MTGLISNRTAGYSGDDISITFGPALINSGYADGEFCTIEMDSDAATDVVGTDGEVCVSRTNDRRATVTIKLLQSSRVNTQLSTLYNLFVRGLPGGIDVLKIKDTNGLTNYVGEIAWISKPPDVSYDRTATSREWTIRVAHLTRTDSASNPIFPGSPV